MTTKTSAVPKPPAGLRKAGRALWTAVLTDFELTEHESVVLREACRIADSLDGCRRSSSRRG